MSKGGIVRPQRGVSAGRPHPLGSHPRRNGVGFSVMSHHAKRMDLLLYDHADDATPARVIPLDHVANRSNDYWHVEVEGIGPGQIYAYRAHGPYEPERGHYFDPDKVLLDPYGRAVATPSNYDRKAAERPGPNDQYAMKSVVADLRGYDWEGDTPLRRPFSQTIIYEMHVKGFTQHPSSGVAPERRGTFAGLIDKIPYLVDLGITAVELLPVFQFDAQEAPEGRTNYWGYSPMSMFAPHAAYACCSEPLAAIDEFRDMVKALHRAGIEVILDVVYNHTAEAGDDGATQSFRGLDNSIYYLMHGSSFADYSGTGNVLNANRAVVRRLIRDSLHYWVEVMHVDGFRFDLASVFARDSDGKPMPNPPMLWDIDTDPVLAGTKLIAEAWDAGGLYQVGHFAGNYWSEWNGRFRDDIRSFVRGDQGCVPRVAQRIAGSPDIYQGGVREAERSVNFVTAHDGFTLNDLVSYEHKHNLDNGENNADGSNQNFSRNYGVEGPTDDPAIEAIRNKQVKNLIAINLLSLGAPMMVMGDEIRRTQQGNNNPYCQDNELSWLDWRLLDEHADIHRFVKKAIRLRWMRDAVRTGAYTPLAELAQRAELDYHGVELEKPDFAHHSHSLAISAKNLTGTVLMYFALNMYVQPLAFELPKLRKGYGPWRRVIDTSLPSPEDIVEDMASAPAIATDRYRVEAQSVVALVAPQIAARS